MTRFSTLIWMLVIVVASFLLYQVKYEVQHVRADIDKLSAELEVERESLRVASAEWAYLNRPERLRQLADKYLATGTLQVGQVAEVEAIPFPQRLEASSQPEAGGLVPASAQVAVTP
jgi:hypothetical protein